ncbi:hypothetical protein PIIN_10979 [Serendipita indica DSM 11827]|uniref:DUF6532 domain-containing protein n=1 Tax=Serendipita indica (strain DSM 11827) TaxID=1109443 RepID=G4U0A1_SERID|nr:hypothetical protein PIIN_10979 [Serendipita indica DSM 11827]
MVIISEAPLDAALPCCMHTPFFNRLSSNRCAIALAATATFSALEEWKTGLCQKIPFTEESYQHTYAMHLRNIKCMIDTIPDQAASLMMSMADYCIACNQAPAPLPSENQDELNELDFFGLDNNITDVDKDNASLKIFDAYDQ